MIRRHHSLAKANIILSILDDMLDEQPNDMWVECFDNCREQGYVIQICSPVSLMIAFAENRNSDQIVVYVYDKTAGFSNLPNEKGWDNKKYFSYNKLFEVAEYIVEVIKEKGVIKNVI